jgi:hypothetical protein
MLLWLHLYYTRIFRTPDIHPSPLPFEDPGAEKSVVHKIEKMQPDKEPLLGLSRFSGTRKRAKGFFPVKKEFQPENFLIHGSFWARADSHLQEEIK